MPEVSHVETDLHCIRCGHNLRTLAWDAKCTECREAVLSSRLPECTQFRSWKEIRLFQLGLALLAVGALIDVARHCCGRMHMWVGFDDFSFLGVGAVMEYSRAFVWIAGFFLLTSLKRNGPPNRWPIVFAVAASIPSIVYEIQTRVDSSMMLSSNVPAWHWHWILGNLNDLGRRIPLLIVLLWKSYIVRFHRSGWRFVLFYYGIVAAWVDLVVRIGDVFGHSAYGLRVYSPWPPEITDGVHVIALTLVIAALMVACWEVACPKAGATSR